MTLSHAARAFVAAVLFQCQLVPANQVITLGHGLLHVEPALRASGAPSDAEPTNSTAPGGRLGLFIGKVKRSVKKNGWPGPPVLVAAMQSSPGTQERRNIDSHPPVLPVDDLKTDILSRISHEDYDITSAPGIKFLDAGLCLMFAVFVVNSFSDVWSFWKIASGTKKEDGSSTPVKSEGQEHFSIPKLIGLTAYRFYTGFLTATWLPYLLAMEGQYLWSANQSMFMGCAKLIYGATILTNPVLGLIGDRAVLLSHGIGRRLFVRIGVACAALGILVCMIAAQIEFFYTFMFGIFLWRIGEAINDVTTEALVPELVSAEQFQVASAVKAAMFLFGGLFGYLLLMASAGVHYSWLYYAYLVGMFISSIPVLLMLNNDSPRTPSGPYRRQEGGFLSEMIEAYLGPIRAEGGFPRACLAVFIFSLGTAPMFFLLLIMRDIVGVKDAVELQEHFSGSSIMFFVCAAVAAVLSGTGPPRPPASATGASDVSEIPSEPSPNYASSEDSPLIKAILQMVGSISLFAMMCFMIPLVGLLESQSTRITIFYGIASVFGYAFGLSFSQFQGITWQLLPQGSDLANAMGFNVMSRLLGLGVGNFVAGLILDFFYVDSIAMQVSPDDHLAVVLPSQAEGEYMLIGYVTMCTASGIMTLTAAVIAYSLVQKFRDEREKQRSPFEQIMAVAG